MNLEQQPHNNITPDGNRVENLVGKYSPADVSQKLQALNPETRKEIDGALNLEGLDFDQVSHPQFLEVLDEEQRKRLSSVIGDIRFHADAESLKASIAELVAICNE